MKITETPFSQGENCVIFPDVTIGEGRRIGSSVFIRSNMSIGSTIGSYVGIEGDMPIGEKGSLQR